MLAIVVLLLAAALACRSGAPGSNRDVARLPTERGEAVDTQASPRTPVLERADAAYESGELEEALAGYRLAIQEDSSTPGLDRALLRLATILLQPEHPESDWRQARRHLERLAREFPSSPHRLEAELLIRLQKEIETQHRQLEQLKELDLERPRSPPG